MNVNDVIWGNVEITDPEAAKIIRHKALQRLKNIWISAYGYLFEQKRNSTRFEHSLGVYLLLRHFKASREEQLAGLIHDVSHTALSHVSTYAFQGRYTGTEFHELQQEKFITESGLEKLLNKIGYKTSDLLHTDKFSLLENSLPDICADRLDYAIRDGLHLQIISRQQADKILEGITVHKGEFVFNNEESAFLYSFNFYLLNLMHYGSASEAHFNNDFGNLVKLAVKKKVLKDQDWFTDDKSLIKKLKESNNKLILKGLGKYNNKLVVFEDSKNPTIIFPKKIRVVNPKVKNGNKIVRLSEISATYKHLMSMYVETHKNHELPVYIMNKA